MLGAGLVRDPNRAPGGDRGARQGRRFGKAEIGGDRENGVGIEHAILRGDTVGEATESRTDLEGDGWRFEVPPSIGDRLEELGRPPSTQS